MADTPASPSPTDPASNPPPAAPAAPPRKRRWLWLKIIGVVLVLLILLVIFAPMIASTAPVRSFVVGKVNENLNGKVEIQDWSIGWTSGISVNGVKVYDDLNRLVLEMARLRTGLSLIDAAKGRYALGETTIDGLNLVQLEVDEQGNTNYQKLLKTEPQKPETDQTTTTTTEPADEGLPQVSGNVKINDFRGTIVLLGQQRQTVEIEPSNIALAIPDLNQPIENAVNLALRVGQGTVGSISLAGKVDAVENNRVDVDKLSADQKLSISSIDLASLEPLLRMAGQELVMGGVANGSLNLTAQGTGSAAADGEFAVANLAVTGGPLQEDVFRTTKLNIPIKVSRQVADGGMTMLKVQTLRVETDHATLAMAVDAPQESLTRALEIIPVALQRAFAGTAATQASVASLQGQGKASLTLDAELAPIVNQLPHLIPLREGTTLEGGKLAHATTIDLSPERALIANKTDLTDVAGTSDGKPVRLEPVYYATQVTIVDDPRPDLRDLSLSLQSAFASITGGGASLAKLDVNGKVDLAKFQAQLEQFMPLAGLLGQSEKVDLSGTGQFSLSTDGDLAQPAGDVATKANLTLNNLKVTGLAGQPPIDQPWLAFNYSGTLQRSGGGEEMLSGIQNALVTLQSGNPDAPTVDLAASADLQMPAMTVPRFELTKLNIPDLTRAQREFGPFLPALQEMQLQLTRGQLSTTAAGSFDGQTLKFSKPLIVTMKNVTAEKGAEKASRAKLLENETIDLNVDGELSLGEAIGGRLTALALTSSSNLISLTKDPARELTFAMGADKAIRANGALAIGADLKRLSDLAEAFTGAPLAGTEGPRLGRGRLDGTVTFARADQPLTTLTGEFNLTNLTVAKYLENESLKISLNAQAPDAFDSLSAAVQVVSSFANVDVKDAQLVLAGPNGAQIAPWEMVQKAGLTVDAPDLAKLYALVQSISPPAPPPPPVEPDADAAAAEDDEAAAEPPLPPLEIRRGSAKVNLAVARENQTTRIDLTDLRLSNLELARGEGTYRFKDDVAVQLAAAMEAGQEIRSINVSQLTGHLGVAELSMSEPIAITNPTGENMSAKGAVKVTGQIERATELLDVLNGAQPGQGLPYRGDYVLAQAVSTQGQQINLTGSATTTKFQVMGADGKVQFAEDQIDITNNLAVNPTAKVATINDLNVNMKSSGAVQLALKGAINDWETQRQFDKILLNLKYDLAKIWQIVYPMLTPEQQADYKTLKIAGVAEKQFKLAGSYPANLKPREAIQLVQADGAFFMESLDYEGILVQKLDVPLYLREGKLRTVYGDRPKGERRAEVASFNGGELDLSRILIDLSTKTPRMSIPKDHVLVKDAQLNASFGKLLGKFVNPMFANATAAKGVLDVKVVYCQDLALGEKIKTKDSGRAKIMFSLRDMNIANPLGSMFISAVKVPGLSKLADADRADRFEGSIQNAVVTIEAGRTTQDITFEIVDPKSKGEEVIGARPGQKPAAPVTHPLRFQGDVNLRSLAQSLSVNIPPGLVEPWFGKEIAELFPSGMPLSMKGTTVKPVIDPGDMVMKTIQGQATNRLGGLLGGGDRDDEDQDEAVTPAERKSDKKKPEPMPEERKKKKPAAEEGSRPNPPARDDEKKSAPDDEKKPRKKKNQDDRDE